VIVKKNDYTLGAICPDLGFCGIKEEYERLMDLGRELYCVMNPDGLLLRVSGAWQRVVSYTPDDLIGVNLFRCVVPEDARITEASLRNLTEGAAAEAFSCRLLCGDGTARRIDWNAQRSNGLIYASGVSVDEQQAPRYLPGEWSDGTTQSAYKDLTVSEKYLRTILETTQDAFVAVCNNKIFDANETFFNMTGYDKDDLGWLQMTDLIAPECLTRQHEAYNRLHTVGNGRFESLNKRKDGSIFNVEVSDALISKEPMITVCLIRDITKRKNAEKKLLDSHELMRFIVENNRNAVAIHDKDLKYMYVSRIYRKMFRLEDRDVIGRHHYEIFPDLPPEAREAHQRALRGEVLRDEDPSVAGDDISNRWECRPWYEEDGSIGGIVLYFEDITETKRMQKMLTNEKEHFKTTLLSVGDGVISTDNLGLITVMNPVAERLTGWTFEEATGKKLGDVLRLINEQTRYPEDDHLEEALDQARMIEYSNNKLVVSRTGRAVPIEISISPIRHAGESVSGAVIIIRDFTEKQAKQRQIEFLSYYDALTGLYNRRYMEDALSRLDTPENLPLALVAIDVNGLKLTNDAFGHEMGDQLLKTVAGILKMICQPDDIIGRMGGDEFCILLKNTDEVQAAALKQRILNEVSHLKLEPVVVSLAIGIAVKKTPAQDIKTILKVSDDHMYQDKIKFGKLMRSQTIQMALQNINLNYEQEQIHTEKVSYYCEAIANAMGFSENDANDIKTAGALHDIGKIMVPSQVLNKPGKLTEEEFDLVKRHPEIGYQMLKMVDEYVRLSEYVLYHHERWDGTGYPVGLRGEKIPLCSRIIALADAFEAMTASRPYQKTKTKDEAIAELKRCAGTQFDPVLVRVFTERVLT
jgi:diguanylate cyclase (GGDEF)-like protein/PAS domain S-box-containing protein